MQFVKVENGEIVQFNLPKVGILKDSTGLIKKAQTLKYKDNRGNITKLK